MEFKLGKGANENYSVDVVIAALNEEEGIGLTLHEMLQNIHPERILVVDGHSCDRTVEVAKDMGATILFQDGAGKGDAIATAVNNIDTEVDYVVVTDADFTYPAEFVPEMIQILEQNPKVGMVCGNRFNTLVEDKAFRNVFYFGNKLLAFSHTLLNGISLEDPLTGLRVIRSCVLRNWKVQSKGFDIEVELNQRVERLGYEIREIPIKYRKRMGEKKLKVSHGASIFKRILLKSNNTS
jgi:glycosyltransferase involved in cell wall biosynthesis